VNDKIQLIAKGHIKIFDPESGEVFVQKTNAIHQENFSIAMANTLANRSTGWIQEMHFGNGGTSVDSVGVITYLPPNITGQNAELYNDTYYKVINDQSTLDTNTATNYMQINHSQGLIYTDILISCLLDYGEPAGQAAFDNSTNFNDTYTFDELGLKSWGGAPDTGLLLTHVIFSPVQKSLNRLIQIDYTIRIQSSTNIVLS
jgi:hypothetical protein